MDSAATLRVLIATNSINEIHKRRNDFFISSYLLIKNRFIVRLGSWIMYISF